VNVVPADELTISMFRETYPRELMKQLRHHGAAIEEKYPGIYYVNGIISFGTQIVVTRQLSPVTHSSLRVLSKNVQAEDIRIFLEEAEKLNQTGDRNNISAVLQVSVYANPSVYEKIEEEEAMNEAMRRLMKDDLEKERA
jgi:hypothetical protein